MSKVSARVIANDTKRNEFFERLKLFCSQNSLNFNVAQNIPYWKIDGLFEISIEIESCRVWNYGKWSEAYKFLFNQDFTIEWGLNDDISLCCYPECDNLDSYFVILHIPSDLFVPKPSKDIRH